MEMYLPNDKTALWRQKSFILAYSIPLAASIVALIILLLKSDMTISKVWTLQSLENFMSLAKIPTYLAAISIPLASLAALNYRSIQTGQANRISNFYDHRKDFVEYMEECHHYTGDTKKNLGSTRRIHSIIFPKDNLYNIRLNTDLLSYFDKQCMSLNELTLQLKYDKNNNALIKIILSIFRNLLSITAKNNIGISTQEKNLAMDEVCQRFYSINLCIRHAAAFDLHNIIAINHESIKTLAAALLNKGYNTLYDLLNDSNLEHANILSNKAEPAE